MIEEHPPSFVHCPAWIDLPRSELVKLHPGNIVAPLLAAGLRGVIVSVCLDDIAGPQLIWGGTRQFKQRSICLTVWTPQPIADPSIWLPDDLRQLPPIIIRPGGSLADDLALGDRFFHRGDEYFIDSLRAIQHDPVEMDSYAYSRNVAAAANNLFELGIRGVQRSKNSRQPVGFTATSTVTLTSKHLVRDPLNFWRPLREILHVP